MGSTVFIFIASLVLIVGMYAFSMLWYSLISKRRGVYAIELIAFVIGLIGIIILLTVANSVEIGGALAAIFGAFFLLPVLISSIISAIAVKLTIMILNQDE